ncbi:multidrug resistance protein homolog 49-like isoform X2 [Hyposmocoma kahamanoa]|uniref:multidrug resistance protein homolog 49-like isoform X2 n=1 Tax=Hyposmocoma kahamanoa TaxID=1477025 RepID=UPI000E6D902A|nr:multidrug resistance protein homolog 49-like isoform X2 [Hyposmocoma kahamanoa]
MMTTFVERSVDNGQVSSYLPMTTFFGGGRRLINATFEERMEALVEDGIALAIGTCTIYSICMLIVVTSVAMVNWSALKQIIRIRRIFFKSVLRQDMAWFDTENDFNFASKMSEDMVKLKDGMGDKLSVVANLIGGSIYCLVQVFPLGWELSLACSSLVPFSIVATIALTKYQTRSSAKESEAYNTVGQHAEEVLKSIKTVVAFGGEDKEIQRYRNLLEPAERFGRKRGLCTGLGNGFNCMLTFSLNTIVLMYGTRLVVEDFAKPTDEKRYIPGDIITILFSVYSSIHMMTMSVPHMEAFAFARGAAASIFKLMDQEPAIDSLNEDGKVPEEGSQGEIIFKDVTFSYPSRPDVKVLDKFSLYIKAGESVALVGSSGCGKSTVLQLIQRLYDPSSGSVTFDGEDTKILNLRWLRSKLGVVGQEPVLFKGTISENISIADSEATRDEIQRVAEMAYAHEFITKLPDGYDTEIGEQGTSLSGGQKQRIAIARALLRNPILLLMDEATSALDSQSERTVQAALNRASIGRTTIVVSHRLSTIVNAHRIICIDHGKVVEEGTHEALMNAKGRYYELVTTGNRDQEPETVSIKENSHEELIAKNIDTTREPQEPSKRKSTEKFPYNRNKRAIVSAGLRRHESTADMELKEKLIEHEEEIKPLNDWELLKLNAPEWLYLVIGSISAFAQGSCYPISAFLLAYAYGIYALPNPNDIIYLGDFYGVVFIVVSVMAGASMCLQSFAFTTSGLKMTTRLRYQYFSSLLRQEIGYFDKPTNTVGAMCARLSGDAAEIQGATGLRVGIILQGISSTFIGFVMSISYSWKLTLVGLAVLPLLVGCVWLESVSAEQSQAAERTALESATSIATEAIVSVRTVQSLGIEKVFMKKFDDALENSRKALSKKTRWRGLVMSLGNFFPGFTYTSATVYGATLVAYEGLEYKTVFLVNEALMYGAFMLSQSLLLSPNYRSTKTCGARILHLINRDPKVKTEPGVRDKEDWTATGSFSIKDVKFNYPTRPHVAVLQGLDLKVEAGKTVALVGSSGCGKSTILQLMQRYYDPASGKIELDDFDTRTCLTLPRLRRQQGVVQQQPVLFDRTLAENISYGDNTREITMNEIVQAAEAANIHNFIVSLPKGYETNVGSSGAQLSGGQKQRVCIARALIRSPHLLLLDEATSALDANSERVVTEALETAAQGRTCITIAHRLSTIKDADLIFVIDKGRIVEHGTHYELLQQNGIYWQMCKQQRVS